jgi:hypothetical protein
MWSLTTIAAFFITIQGTQAYYSSCICMSDSINGKAAGKYLQDSTVDACKRYWGITHGNHMSGGRCTGKVIDGDDWWSMCLWEGAESGQCY